VSSIICDRWLILS